MDRNRRPEESKWEQHVHTHCQRPSAGRRGVNSQHEQEESLSVYMHAFVCSFACMERQRLHVELRFGRAIYGRVVAQSFDMTQNTAQHKIFWAVPVRHEHEGRTVPKISAWRATCPGLHLEPCLDRHGTKMARRHFYNYTIQFSIIYYTTSYLILK
jgi:hypothetical protein